MSSKNIYVTIFVISICATSTVCIEPVSGFAAGFAAVSAMATASFSYIFCWFHECCTETWIVNNITGLEAALDNQLYGQHLVKKVVTSQIKGHLRTSDPSKALVMSFHGPTGTGKNHVSRIIAEHLFKKGMKSENVVLISVTKEFPHKEKVTQYKDHLREVIESHVRKCPHSMFIFDEIDKMPAGLIDTIKPYIDYHEQLNGVDYRKSMFMFLSNAGGRAITEYTLDHWKAGGRREDIKLVDVEKILAKAAVNSETEGGLWHSELITKHLVSAFIPFLPLERFYVRLCIRDMLVNKRYYSDLKSTREDMVQKVVEELTFYPPQEQIFSETGCKRVAEKVDYVMS